MKAGSLDRRVTIETPTSSKNSFGETLTTWGTLATVWAGKFTLRVAEVERLGGRQAAAEFKLSIRWRDDVTQNMRVILDGSPYDITGIEEIGRREGLNLFVRGAVS